MFAFGLMVGLTVAGGFFVLKLDDYFHKLKSFKPIVTSSETVNEKQKPSQDAENTDPKRVKKVIVEASPMPTIATDSIQDSTQTTLLAQIDSLNKEVVGDTMIVSVDVSEEIVIRKDELVTSMKVEVMNINKDSSTVSPIDSLLENVSGIRDDHNKAKQFLDVELWQSPLNYKGYKLSKNRLLVYGLAAVDGAQLYMLDEITYFRNDDLVYQLEVSNNFNSYQLITDPLIIDQLK